MMIATLVARLLGFARDMVLYSWFGQTYATDAYNAAFSIPDFIYMLLVGGALASAFIPVFSGYLAQEKEEEAWKVASIVFNFTMVLLLVLIAVALVFTRSLMVLLAPDLPAHYINMATTLTRVMFIQTFFMALNGIIWGILNSKQEFTAPALGSIVYNAGIIAVGLLMAHKWGVMAFSIGVVAGSVLNFLVQIPALLRTGLKYYPSFNLKHPGFKRIMFLMAPVLLGLSISQINLFVTQNLASGLAEGSISALRLAQRVMQLPIGIFGTSIALVIFPAMTAYVSKLEIADFKKTFSLGLRAIFLITVPAGVGLIALRTPIVSLLFQQGRFNATDTSLTAVALLFYSLGLFAYSALQLLNRVFYSLQDTLTPVLIGAISIALNIGFSILLIPYMQHGALALAYSVAGIFNILVLMVILRRRLKTMDGFRILKSFVISAAASGIMYLATSFTAAELTAWLSFAPKLNQLITVVVGIGVGTLVYALAVIPFRLEETNLIIGYLKRLIPGIKSS
jgi:putative peptidoglycan lipid II flippase